MFVFRGSYTAAQKAFEKVLMLSPNSSYARLMIAGIRHRVGRWREAVHDYQQILGTRTVPTILPTRCK